MLSTDTGFRRNYQAQAYASYFASDRTMFPVPHVRKELPNKAWVVGVIVNGQAKAYPVQALPANRTIADRVGDNIVHIRYDAEHQYPQVVDAQAKPIASVMVFWFAWQAFYPRTELWSKDTHPGIPVPD